jgi:hypothetical protein
MAYREREMIRGKHMAPEETRPPTRAKPVDEVRAFYESHPYPAPLRDLDRHEMDFLEIPLVSSEMRPRACPPRGLYAKNKVD